MGQKHSQARKKNGRISLRLTDEQVSNLRRLAEVQGMPINEAVSEAVLCRLLDLSLRKTRKAS